MYFEGIKKFRFVTTVKPATGSDAYLCFRGYRINTIETEEIRNFLNYIAWQDNYSLEFSFKTEEGYYHSIELRTIINQATFFKNLPRISDSGFAELLHKNEMSLLVEFKRSLPEEKRRIPIYHLLGVCFKPARYLFYLISVKGQFEDREGYLDLGVIRVLDRLRRKYGIIYVEHKGLLTILIPTSLYESERRISEIHQAESDMIRRQLPPDVQRGITELEEELNITKKECPVCITEEPKPEPEAEPKEKIAKEDMDIIMRARKLEIEEEVKEEETEKERQRREREERYEKEKARLLKERIAKERARREEEERKRRLEEEKPRELELDGFDAIVGYRGRRYKMPLSGFGSISDVVNYLGYYNMKLLGFKKK